VNHLDPRPRQRASLADPNLPGEPVLRNLQTPEGAGAVRARDLSRTHRERPLRNGFLQEVIKGWYIPSRPDEVKGDSTAWYASFWRFCTAYLEARFGAHWCLSPEQSLSLHAGNWTVPGQLAARSPRAGNKVTKLPHSTSLLELRIALPGVADRKEEAGLRLFSMESALIACSPNHFSNNATEVRAVLPMIRDASGLLAQLLEGGHTVIAGRLAGAFRNVGRDRIADDIVKTMTAADYAVRENDPFTDKPSLVIGARETSPWVNRLRLLWQKMREPVIERLPKAPGPPRNIKAYLKCVTDAYVTDAYHSLSIEGYRVTRALIERVRSGTWNPEADENDREQRNAMAARGYWQAFQAVQKSLGKILKGENPGEDADHGTWYRDMFAPSVTVVLLKPADLADYRNGQVYIRKSMHVPPNRDALPTFFDLLREEPNPSVRVVLGRFIFVYIHPYMDGNGRVGRFLMNTMMASGGYPWTVIPAGDRNAYVNALEKASVGEDIAPFADILAGLVRKRLAGEPLPAVPKSSPVEER
jgi:hypothetical protein